MKGVKGKLLKKLKTIKQINYLNPDRILQVKSSDGYVDFLPKITSFNISNPFVSRENESKKIVQNRENLQEEEPEIIDVSELMRDLEEAEKMVMDDDDYSENKENISHKGAVLVSQSRVNDETELKQSEVLREKKPPLVPRANNCDRKRKKSISENDNLSFRRPDLNSGSLFDPDLLAAFEEAVKEHSRMMEEQRKNRVEEQIEKIEFFDENEEVEVDPLLFFEEKCPPGGDGTVIFYTTSLRGIRKTFEDCNKIRFLLQSFKVLYLERDVSMHKEFRDELWSILGEKIVPPRLFIKGRYIGAAEEVLSLHEQGKLKKILEGVPIDYSDGPCDSCGGLRFVMCFKCNGSHKILAEKEEIIECLLCNENGLIVCPYCG